MRGLPSGVGPKVALAIVPVTLLLVGTFGALVVRAQRAILVEDAIRNADVLSDTIRRSAHHAMLEDRREDAYRIMAAIGAQPGIERVRVFNKEGRITWSTSPGETGSFVDKKAESCYACHAADRPITRLAVRSRARLYAGDGHRILAMVTPIYNEPSCSTAACHAHAPSQTVLGVVDVGITMAAADATVGELTRITVALSLVTVVVLAGTATLAARALVVKPVQELEAATRRVAAGHLDEELRVRSPDELGRLAGSFNHMRGALSEARAQLQSVLAGLEHEVEERTASLREAQAQLAQSERLASLGRLSASIAHEINNPLAGILTFSRVLIRTLEQDGAAPAPRQAMLPKLRLIERETGRCAAIVRSLLDFARQKPLVLQPVDLSAVVDEALTLVVHRLVLENVALEKDLATIPRVRGDFGHLRQALVNVIMNACDATPAGGRVRVATRLVDGQAELEVSDTGAGIAPDDLKKLFEPFFSTKEKGTGLGLAVVYGIVQRHEGTIDVRSEVGRGTSVRMRLPLA
jgi:two-component system NtrC family sensor kinase